MPDQTPWPTFPVPGTTSHTIAAPEGTLRYLKAGTGAPLVLLHTVRTQAEHFRDLIPLVADRYTVYALDLPGMGYSEIVPGASYEEPAMRAGVERLLTELDLDDVTLLGESMGAVLALTTAADLPDRVRRVVAVNAYDFRGGIARSGLLARAVVTGVLAPGVGPLIAGVEPKAVMRRILRGGLGDKTALREDYLDELLRVGRRPGYPAVAWASTGTCPASSRPAPATPKSRPPSTSSTASRTGPDRRTGRPTRTCCPTPNSPRCRARATSSPWNGPRYWPPC